MKSRIKREWRGRMQEYLLMNKKFHIICIDFRFPARNAFSIADANGRENDMEAIILESQNFCRIDCHVVPIKSGLLAMTDIYNGKEESIVRVIDLWDGRED